MKNINQITKRMKGNHSIRNIIENYKVTGVESVKIKSGYSGLYGQGGDGFDLVGIVYVDDAMSKVDTAYFKSTQKKGFVEITETNYNELIEMGKKLDKIVDNNFGKHESSLVQQQYPLSGKGFGNTTVSRDGKNKIGYGNVGVNNV